MPERNRLAEAHGLMLEAQEETSQQYMTPQGREETWREMRADILYLMSELVNEREEKSKFLRATAASYFQLKRAVEGDDKHIEWLRAEIKARNDELTVVYDTLHRRNQEVFQLTRGRVRGRR